MHHAGPGPASLRRGGISRGIIADHYLVGRQSAVGRGTMDRPDRTADKPLLIVGRDQKTYLHQPNLAPARRLANLSGQK